VASIFSPATPQPLVWEPRDEVRVGFTCAAPAAHPDAGQATGRCDNDSIRHARAVTAYLGKHPQTELLYGARYSPHDNPVELVQ
jgi:hypothetical protein